MKILKTFLIVLGIGFGGIALGFFALFLGCRDSSLSTNNMCGHNTLGSLAAFTFAGWFVLGVAASFMRSMWNKE
jgi:hypothetical protein